MSCTVTTSEMRLKDLVLYSPSVISIAPILAQLEPLGVARQQKLSIALMCGCHSNLKLTARFSEVITFYMRHTKNNRTRYLFLTNMGQSVVCYCNWVKHCLLWVALNTVSVWLSFGVGVGHSKLICGLHTTAVKPLHSKPIKYLCIQITPLKWGYFFNEIQMNRFFHCNFLVCDVLQVTGECGW